MNIDVIIPAFNEENGVGMVIKEIPQNLVREIVVVNNNSADQTSKRAKDAGAIVLEESQMGYGMACQKGIHYLKLKEVPPDIVVFLDADYSDYPEQMNELIQPILKENYDLVIGSRALGKREIGAMTFQQKFGNWLATRLIKLFYGTTYTDLGPFRAIKFQQLLNLHMKDSTYGWTVEMQLKAAKMNLKVCEIPVDYRRRIGFSKISGTIKGTIGAGYKIIITIFKYL